MPDVGARLETRILIRVGLSLWLLAAFALAWEALALQAPDSPLHVGILAGPIAQLCSQSFGLGAGLFVAAALWPLTHARDRGRFTLALLLAGAVLSSAALTYAASEGIVGAQVYDPRPDARRVVYARGVGLGLLVLALLDILLRSLRAGPRRDPPD